jgi:PhoH-like ATPase
MTGRSAAREREETRPEGKTFVVDTNVLLYDYNCIDNFQDNDVVIPITVLEELDEFKKGNDLINFHAREFIRRLDSLAGDRLFTEGIPLGANRGKLFVKTSRTHSELVDNVFMHNKADHRILALADELRRASPGKPVIVISKDINLRMKAKSLGIQAEDYETGKIADLDQLYNGCRTVESLSPQLISKFYEQPHAVALSDLGLDGLEPRPHEYFILRNGSSSVLAVYNPVSGMLERVAKQRVSGIDPRNAEQAFAVDALMRPAIQLLTLTGRAGTGKTLLALAAALEQRRNFRQIFLARPVVPLGNRDLGYLPGDVKSKLDPYMQPLWDNLAVIRNRFSADSHEQRQIADMLEQEKLHISPLAYIRGRSLDRVFFIVDEAQNLTPHEVKTIITRAGEGTRMVFTGDLYQIDTPYLDSQSNGLAYLVDKMKGQALYAQVNLVKGERSVLAELASTLL